MDLLDVMRSRELEQIVVVNDPATGLIGFIVIHDTTRGPGIGGCRLAPYASGDEALLDAIDLAQAMTRKCALAGLNAGGAKGVFIEHDGIKDRPAMMRALGRYVESLCGRFYTSGDLGIDSTDIKSVRESTRFVAMPDSRRLDLAGGTAEGVLAGMRAALKAVGGPNALEGRKVAVQGLGSMGGRVLTLLLDAGAQVFASDLKPENQATFAALGVEIVPPDAIYDLDVDIFSPCALSRVLNARNIARLKATVVVGAANNQLASEEADHLMHARGIKYAPDYAVNAGAVVLGATNYLERMTDGRATIERAAQRILETTEKIFKVSARTNEPPGQVADRLAVAALIRPKTTEHQWWPIR